MFSPVFKANSSVTATLAIALTITLEVGIDILKGKFKATVGLTNKPALYGKATISNEPGAACPGQVELIVGLKNDIYVSALNLWKYDIDSQTIFDESLGCLGPNEFGAGTVEPDASIFVDVPTEFHQPVGQDIASTFVPNVTDIADQNMPPSLPQGYRIIMEASGDGVLVAGNDGLVYIVPTAEQYDLSAPWGSINVTTGRLDMDVFGRILASRNLNGIPSYHGLIADLRLFKPEAIPLNYYAAGLTVLKDEREDFNIYGITVTLYGYQKWNNPEPGDGPDVWYPFVCESQKGLRLLASRLPLSGSGNSAAFVGPIEDKYESAALLLDVGFDINICFSIKLIAKPDSDLT